MGRSERVLLACCEVRIPKRRKKVSLYAINVDLTRIRLLNTLDRIGVLAKTASKGLAERKRSKSSII